MFGSDKKKIFSEKRKDTERSLISETVSIDGTVNSSGSIDIAGLIKGPVNSHEVVIKDTTIKILLKKKKNIYLGKFKDMEFISTGN